MIADLDESEKVAHEDLTQRETVLKHLQEVGPLTPLEAMYNYGIGRLAPRILELRKDGHPIETQQDSPHDFATYKYSD